MSDNNIEKFSGEFEKEELGVSILLNETINMIKDRALLGVYCYLASRPPRWRIKVKQLQDHFECSKDTIYKLLKKLIDLNLLSCKEIKKKGKFIDYRYSLHLKPLENKGFQPCPKKPDTEFPDTEKPDAYKTKKITNKENITTTIKSIVSIYHEMLPECPAIRVIDSRLDKQLRAMIKRWPEYQADGEAFSIDSFKNYLTVLKTHYSWIVQPYTTQEGNTRQNNLRTLTRESTISRIVNGEFTANENAY